MTTATLQVRDSKNHLVSCRTLLDTCSTANFMTENLAAKLRLRRRKCSIPVGALNDLSTTSEYVVNATIRSRHTNIEKSLEFLVISRISELVPQQYVDRGQLHIPSNVQLADPEFHKPAPIDMLLGAGPTLSLLSVGQITLSRRPKPELVLQKTQLGWIIGGSIQTSMRCNQDRALDLGVSTNDRQSSVTRQSRSPSNAPDVQSLTNGNSDRRGNEQRQNQRSSGKNSSKEACHVTHTEFDMKKFWEIEECPSTPHLSSEEQACEEHFQHHIQRSPTGRYVVALPFNQNKERLGHSRIGALKRFTALQRRFKQDPTFHKQYAAVMQEYLDLGHMSEVEDPADHSGFYLPHHAVIKESSLTTKLRVVFDGSAKTDTGVSLNEALMVGPTVQDDLFSHILRFRFHTYVLTGDLEKMYRQFTVRKEDRQFQRIFWTDSNDNVKTYELNTVTFGLAPASFLATRCLQQLADDEGQGYPLAKEVLKRDLYVDDLLTGASTIEEASRLRDEMISLLHHGDLKIRQWASNAPDLLQGLPEGTVNLKLESRDDKTLKTLGVCWNSHQDSIVYSVKPINVQHKTTKRIILSEIARIFDPLGLLGPVILTAKILMQELWQLKLNWDESVPTSIHTSWTTFCRQLNLLNDMIFHRQITLPRSTNLQIHGFCDASENGYGACIYLRSTNAVGDVQSRLLCSKSRVAPLKAISLPRLELCGALLLANLYYHVRQAITVNIDHVTFWTDSTITLHWIHTSPHLLKTFVANRVSEIQTRTSATMWRHVSSQDNPADPLSRGLLPAELLQHPIWQTGPKWLIEEEADWPRPKISSPLEVPEIRKRTCLASTQASPSTLLQRYSSINKLRRIVAYCLRFKRDHAHKGLLNSDELNKANQTILRMVQGECFTEEIHDLKQGKQVHRKSKLIMLDPFLDQDGLIRVGGRLKHAELPFSQQHPIVLPRSHHITTLFILETHIRNLHAGIQTTLYSLRQRYWPIDGRNQTRKVIRQCVKCYRAHPPPTNYVMGNLPRARVNEDRPFNNVGIDYCGPFFIKEKRFRNRNRIKVYVAVFVCLTVKAVHLELVSDLTTEGFIAALRRFIARRGKCQAIYSDNGTNFVGANNELEEIHRLVNTETPHPKVQAHLSKEGIRWHFIPPRSPHFGGLWEAAVKSFKHHLRRVIGNELLTFEEFNSFIIETEAILNSRPLTPISSDPNDLSALTPGHFLIGNPMNVLPEIDFSRTRGNRLSTWQHLQKIKRDFWTRWNKEYLNELNIRHKWTSGHHGINKGTLVILKEDNLPPQQWTLGRVIEVHPGSDNIIRTVTVKTSQGIVKRNIRKLAPLPIETCKEDTCS